MKLKLPSLGENAQGFLLNMALQGWAILSQGMYTTLRVSRSSDFGKQILEMALPSIKANRYFLSAIYRKSRPYPRATEDNPFAEFRPHWTSGVSGATIRQTAPPLPEPNGWEEAVALPEPTTPSKFVYKGQTFWMRFIVEETADSRYEYIDITTRGRGHQAFKSLVQNINDANQEGPVTHTRKKVSMGGQWNEFGKTLIRRPETLFLAFTPSESHSIRNTQDVVADVHSFMRSKEEYQRLGKPYRKGYRLSGVKGSGKTSLAAVIAGVYQADIFSVNAGECGDAEMIALWSQLPSKAVVVFEDLDVLPGLILDRERDPHRSGVSLSTLLNVLDGVYSREGIITVATTNFTDDIDPALLRAGRFDVTLEFTTVTKEQIIGMWELHFPTEPVPHPMIEGWVKEKLTTSDVQGLLMNLKGSV